MPTQVTITGPETKQTPPHEWKAGDWFKTGNGCYRQIVCIEGKYTAASPRDGICLAGVKGTVEELMAGYEKYDDVHPISRVEITVHE